MAGLLTVDTIQSDSSYASTLNVASKINFTSGMQIGGQDTTFGGMRNRIINGDMRIDQRNAGASKTITDTADVTYTLDRWFGYGTAASKFSVQQDAGAVTPPTGFTDYLGVTSLSAYSVTSSDSFSLGQSIEGFNIADLGWGTANAKTVTLSFWVRSSLTGTFGGAIRNSAANRSYPFTYTVSASNTWEQKSLTIAGDTSGTWLTTNGIGIRVGFGLGQGSTSSGTAGAWASSNFNNATGATSVVGTNGATFYITGVQLEKGSTATAFENRQYGTELALCQRYFQQIGGGEYVGISSGINFSTGLVVRAATVKYNTTMRSTPTQSISGTLIATDRAGFDTDISSISGFSGGVDSATLQFVKSSVSGTDYYIVQIAVKGGTTSFLRLNSEL
jgi:hypothetical protein